jgi:quercetin dioxygenase-like cupin family protein
MNVHNIFDIPGMEMPAGRKTRVMIGSNGAIDGEYFCQGYVVMYPNGSIPEHTHETVETYTILKGVGKLTVDGEQWEMHEGDFMYIDRNQKHGLVNIGKTDLHLMFVYAPKMVVSHWAEEQAGTL